MLCSHLSWHLSVLASHHGIHQHALSWPCPCHFQAVQLTFNFGCSTVHHNIMHALTDHEFQHRTCSNFKFGLSSLRLSSTLYTTSNINAAAQQHMSRSATHGNFACTAVASLLYQNQISTPAAKPLCMRYGSILHAQDAEILAYLRPFPS